MTTTLACGPFFSEVGMWVSIVALAAVKPLTYFAFIQAFRYRVSRAIPMSFRRAAGLAAVRAGVGLVLVGGAWLALRAADGATIDLPLAWGVLIAERVGVWAALGWIAAGLRGRRLVGWTLSGAGIDVAFDAAVASSLLDQWAFVGGIGGAMAAFIVALTVIGRRRSLKARFGGLPMCAGCQYDLTGNLSGRCPECGRVIAAAA